LPKKARHTRNLWIRANTVNDHAPRPPVEAQGFGQVLLARKRALLHTPKVVRKVEEPQEPTRKMPCLIPPVPAALPDCGLQVRPYVAAVLDVVGPEDVSTPGVAGLLRKPGGIARFSVDNMPSVDLSVF